ncbi:MAG: prolyl oligopeptidase family serine peptidase [Lachnospiraceae bacterium]|nr:prolyl oligopeptidase family serine peptidase [Robinsoniella sp.]MDY3765601.1 prolyl oligopeptidase family serine peptidase [Lachnospiraceae bacterium]
MKNKKVLALLAAACLTLGMTSMVSSAAEADGVVASTAIFVQGYEWGPGVPKIIVELQKEASEVSAEGCAVTTAGKERTVTDVYLCDENGEKAEGASKYVAIEMETRSEVSGSPFSYDISVFMNKWSEAYQVTVDCPDFTVDGEAAPLAIDEDCIGNRICPDTAMFNSRDSFTGTYMNNITGEEEEITLRTAAYEPESLADGEKNPLIIWLHGQGEGGTDPDIEIIGNEVCALARPEIQSYFSAGDQQGAYVLAVQCETYWMDEGDGTNGKGSGVSRYTEILMDTIADYVDSHPDVDPNRIYLGGCSNGGYMTMNMIINYPDYFAAAYPNCEAYAFYEYEKNEDGTYKQDGTVTETRWVTDEKIEAIKDIPIWFVLSVNDPVVDPKAYELPTYRALVQAGAENTWLSLFETIEGTDSEGTEYMGHFAWVKLFNNEVTGVQDREAIAASTDNETFGAAPTNNGGGELAAGEFTNIFAWLNAQSK